jgi:murein DD-endopeptidase MepM/ murein hydrolase activator NlpD
LLRPGFTTGRVRHFSSVNHLRSQVEGTWDLDQGKRRGASRPSAGAEFIDLGNEAPLSVDGQSGNLVDRRRVSVQWFSGTVLTGLCGAALMGGAVFAALDGETNFATVPERVEAALRAAANNVTDRWTNATRKADRLPPAGETNAARQVIRVSTTTRGANNREIVRVRPFVRVAGNLSLSVSELSASIPRFNAQKMLAPDASVAAADDAGAEPDAEVSFFTRDLTTVLPRAKIAAVMPLDDVLARVRDAVNWNGQTGKRPLIASTMPVGSLAYAPERHSDIYAGFEPRIVPENITLLAKTTTQTNGGNAWGERTIALKKGDSVSTNLRDLGATPEDVKAITAAFGSRGRDTTPRDGYKLRVLLAPSSGGKRLQPVRVVIATDNAVEAIVAWSDKGKYVSVDPRSANSVASAGDDEEDDGKGVRLYHSIYETAMRNHVPRPVIDDLIRVYSYDVDFQRKVQPGDSFEILFAGEDENANDGSKSEVLFASLTTGGETRKFYRYQSLDDNAVDYYDESGKSAKKFLVRKPLAEGIMRSGFGSRNHPILGTTRMHTGVDWGANMGTPIFASGNGVIEKAGLEGGYGKYIRVRHANGYETAYGHMSAFARGMEPGKRVRQGQVIGYVGSTGLSTGAHLHYEILINGRFVDPMKIKLPRGRVLQGPVLAGFDQERDRLDNMMNRDAPSRYAPGVAAAR